MESLQLLYQVDGYIYKEGKKPSCSRSYPTKENFNFGYYHAMFFLWKVQEQSSNNLI